MEDVKSSQKMADSDEANQPLNLEQFMGFPETLAKVSNRSENSQGVKIVFRNYYRHADE